MADDVENLQITISANDAGAAALLADVRTKIAAIETELAGMGTAGQAAGAQVAAGAERAAAGVAGANKAAAESRAVFGELNSVGGDAARAFSALGIEGGAAAARVGALAGALGSLREAAPALLLLVGAGTALVAVFDYFKQGVKDAEDLQAAMSSMSLGLRTQGNDWNVLSEQIKAFVASESLASGFSQGELSSALNSLVTSLSGVESATAAVTDSEKILAVAEEVAVAKHMDLVSVVHMLTEAEAGRGLGLAQLDPRLKEVIHDHGTLDQVLQILHTDYGRELDDTNATALAQARLHAAYAGVGQELGSEMLPLITRFSTMMIGLIPAVEDVAKALADGLGGALNVVVGPIHASYHAMVALFDVMHGNLKGGAAEFSASLKGATDTGKGFASATIGWMGDLSHVAGDYSKAYVLAEHEIAAAIAKHLALLKDVNTTFNPQLGFPKSGGSGSGFTPPVLTDAIDQNKLDAAAQAENADTSDRLADAKDRAAVAEAALNAAMKASTTVAGEQNAAAALDTQKLKDLGEQYKILNDSIYSESQMLKADTTAKEQAAVVYHAAESVLNSFAQAHKGEKNMAESVKETYEALKVAVQNAKTAYDDADRSVKSLTSTMRTHREELARDAASELEIASSARDAAATAEREWDKYYTDEQRKMAEDLATSQMTTRQKLAYFASSLAEQQALIQQHQAQLTALYAEDVAAFKAGDYAKVSDLQKTMAQISTLIGQEVDLAKQYDQDELSAYKSMLQEELDARKAVLEKEQQLTQTFLDDILTEHKTFGEELKSVLDSWVKDYLAAMSKIIFPTTPGSSTGPSTNPFAQFFSGFFGVSSASQNSDTTRFSTSTTQFQTAVSQFQAAVARIGPGAVGGGGLNGGQQIATFPTPTGNALVTYTGGVDAEEITNDYGAVSPGSVPALPGDVVSSYMYPTPGSTTNIGWGANSAASLMNVDTSTAEEMAAGGAGAPTAVSSALSKYGSDLMEALMGYMIGQSVNSLMYPNEMPGQSSSIFSGIGGAIGDVAGNIFGGPAGGFIGAILGSLFGGLFGSHETAAQMPDVSEPNYGTPWNYGQFVSNMIGTYGTYNGQYIQAQPGYYGDPMGMQVFNELKSLPDNLSPVIEGLASQLRALERGDTNPNALEIKSESQGMFTLESGAQISVQSYMQMIGQFMAATAGMIPTFTLSRAYPNFNQSTLKETGVYDPTVSYGTGAQGVPPPPPVQGQPGYPNGPNAQQRPIQVNITVTGDIIGDGQVPDKLALAVAQALQRMGVGTAAGGLTRRAGTTTAGGDWF